VLGGRRILISMIQVLSQLGVVYSIPFPGLYANLLRWVGALELNFVEILPLGCVYNVSFYEVRTRRRASLARVFTEAELTLTPTAQALLVRTLTLPLLGVAVLPVWLLRARPAVLDFCSGALFLILFLIYPSTSAAIFATFQCEPLDDGSSWLRADLSIDCNSPTHNWYVWYASCMVLVYPVGTPLLYYVILRCHKKAVDRLRVNQALRVQLLDKVRADRI